MGSSEATAQWMSTMPSASRSCAAVTLIRYQSVSLVAASAQAVPWMTAPLVMLVKTGGVELQPPLVSLPQASFSCTVADAVLSEQGSGPQTWAARLAHAVVQLVLQHAGFWRHTTAQQSRTS